MAYFSTTLVKYFGGLWSPFLYHVKRSLFCFFLRTTHLGISKEQSRGFQAGTTPTSKLSGPEWSAAAGSCRVRLSQGELCILDSQRAPLLEYREKACRSPPQELSFCPESLQDKFQTTRSPLLSDLAQMGRQTQGNSAACAKALMFLGLPSGSTASSGPRGQTQGEGVCLLGGFEYEGVNFSQSWR